MRVHVDPFELLHEGEWMPRKNGIAWRIDGRYGYASYADWFRDIASDSGVFCNEWNTRKFSFDSLCISFPGVGVISVGVRPVAFFLNDQPIIQS